MGHFLRSQITRYHREWLLEPPKKWSKKWVKKWSKWVILGDSIHGRFIGVSRTKPVLSPRARARARARGILKMTHFWITFWNGQRSAYMGNSKKGFQKWVIFIEDALLGFTHFYPFLATFWPSFKERLIWFSGQKVTHFWGIPASRDTQKWVIFWPKNHRERPSNGVKKVVKMGHSGGFHTWPVYRCF